MTIGGSIFLIAIGAILRFAVNVDSSSVSIDVIGNILMIAGAAGLLLGLFFYANNAASRRKGSGGMGGPATPEPLD